MKFKDIMNVSINQANKQISFNLKKKELKKLGMSPEQLLELTLIKPKTKFYKKGGKNGNKKRG